MLTYRIPPIEIQRAIGFIIDFVADDGHEDDIDKEDDGGE